MPVIRAVGQAQGLVRPLAPGDVQFFPIDTSNSIAVDDEVTIPVAGVLAGFVNFTGTGGFTARFPSAASIYEALVVGVSPPDIQEGIGFALSFTNNAADFVEVNNSADGSVSGVSWPIVAGKGFDVLAKFVSVQQPAAVSVVVEQNSFTVMLVQEADIGATPFALNLSVGALVSVNEDFFPGAVTITSLIYGKSGLIGFTTSDSPIASGTTGLIIGPKISVVGLRVYDISVIT